MAHGKECHTLLASLGVAVFFPWKSENSQNEPGCLSNQIGGDIHARPKIDLGASKYIRPQVRLCRTLRPTHGPGLLSLELARSGLSSAEKCDLCTRKSESNSGAYCVSDKELIEGTIDANVTRGDFPPLTDVILGLSRCSKMNLSPRGRMAKVAGRMTDVGRAYTTECMPRSP
jgi:hypothetical protein